MHNKRIHTKNTYRYLHIPAVRVHGTWPPHLHRCGCHVPHITYIKIYKIYKARDIVHAQTRNAENILMANSWMYASMTLQTSIHHTGCIVSCFELQNFQLHTFSSINWGSVSWPHLLQNFPSPRWTCLKKLSEHYMPRFEIRVFLLLGTGGPRCLILYYSAQPRRASSIRHPEDAPQRCSTPARGLIMNSDVLQCLASGKPMFIHGTDWQETGWLTEWLADIRTER